MNLIRYSRSEVMLGRGVHFKLHPQVALKHADTLGMYAIKNPMRANTWYRAYLKDSARLVTVKCLGVTNDGLRFTDREQNVYTPNDFYFWKSAGED